MTTPDRMTPTEALVLCRFAAAACPQQKFDQYTPDAWFELLRDIRATDAHAALVDIVKAKPFVAPAEIRDEVARVRRARVERFGPIPAPPFEIGQDPSATLAYQRAAHRAIADGEVTQGEPLTAAIGEARVALRAAAGVKNPDALRVLPPGSGA